MHKLSDDRVQPIHANGIYHITSFGAIWQSLFYDYQDPDGYYYALTHNQNQHQKEITRLWSNMQFLLDHEKFLINNHRCKQQVTYVNYDHHGVQEFPYVYFLIYIQGPLVTGKNSIVSHVVQEIAQYDFELIWCLPPKTLVTDIDTTLEFEQIGTVVNLWGRKGDLVGGMERIDFELRSNSSDDQKSM